MCPGCALANRSLRAMLLLPFTAAAARGADPCVKILFCTICLLCLIAETSTDLIGRPPLESSQEYAP
jgi:hypothetical protein